MNINSQLNSNKISQAKNLELDKELLKELFDFQEKQKPKYIVIHKKTIYDIETNHPQFKKRDEYYSNYKYFRHYLLTSYTTDFANRELNLINTLLRFSSALRKDLNGQYNLNIFKENKEERKDSMTNTIVDSLLKLKSSVDNTELNKYYFCLYSEFKKESNQFAIPQYENFTYIKYYSQNRKLTNLLQIESAFINCVKNFSVNKIKEMKPLFISTIPDDKKTIINVHSLFYGRDIDYFKSIDTFMSYYKEDFLKIKDRENELFEGIYEILSKCNCVNFLSYLYSKSSLFKFIYDIFTKKKENMFERLNMPGIEKEKVTEPFLNESLRDWFKEPSSDIQLPIKKKIELRTSIQPLKQQLRLDEYNDVFGCSLFEKIEFVEQRLAFNEIVSIINTSQKSSKDLSSSIARKTKSISSFQYQFESACMLINKNSAIKIFHYDLSEVNHPIIFELLEDIDVIKVDPRRLGDDWISKVKNEEMYLISLNLEQDNNEDKKYYIIKLKNQISIQFEELAKERIKSFEKEFEDRNKKDESNSDHLSAVNSALLNSLLNK